MEKEGAAASIDNNTNSDKTEAKPKIGNTLPTQNLDQNNEKQNKAHKDIESM